MKTRGSFGIYLRTNRAAYNEWNNHLSTTSDVDNLPLLWVSFMLQEPAALSSTAQEIADHNIPPEKPTSYQAHLCGICCRLDSELIAPTTSAEEYPARRDETDRVTLSESHPVAQIMVNRKSCRKRNARGQLRVPLSAELIEANKRLLLNSWYWRAAKRGDTNAVKDLIGKGVDIRSFRIGGYTTQLCSEKWFHGAGDSSSCTWSKL